MELDFEGITEYSAGRRIISFRILLMAFAPILPLPSCMPEDIKETAACLETDQRPSGDKADDPAIWVNRAAPELSMVLATDKRAGLGVYDLTGHELQLVELGGLNNVDLRPDFPFPDNPAPMIAVTNMTDATVTLLRIDEKIRRVVSEPVARIPGFTGESGVCMYRARDGTTHVGATGDRQFRQWRLSVTPDGTILAEVVRSLTFRSEVEGCAYDDALHRLYLAEQSFAIWRLPAEPEDGDAAVIVDHINPQAGFPADVEGLAILARENRAGYLLASNQGNSTIRVYRRDGHNAYLGRFRIAGCPTGTVGPATNTDGIEVTSSPLGSEWPGGLLVVQNDDKNFKLVDWCNVERQFFQNANERHLSGKCPP